MAGDWDEYCVICASRGCGAALRIAEERETDAAPPARTPLETLALCRPCSDFVAETLRPRSGAPVVVDGWPELDAEHSHPNGAECGQCAAPIDGESFIVELSGLPASSAPDGAGEVQLRDRLCRSCLTWVRDTIDAESVARWARRRPSDAPGDAWLPAGAWAGRSLHLSHSDAAIARQTLEHLGGSLADWVEGAPTFGERDLLLVAAGGDGSCTALVGSLPVAQRWRVVVVATPESAEDALHALRAGAGDLLASPLSRQQVAGTVDRLSDRESVIGSDPELGLPRYALRGRYGLPAYRLRLDVQHEADAFGIAILLRRFLRGYDRLSTAADGSLEAHVCCPTAELGAVVRRASRLLRPSCRIDVCGLAEEMEVQPHAATTGPRSPLARAFFGRRLDRAS